MVRRKGIRKGNRVGKNQRSQVLPGPIFAPTRLGVLEDDSTLSFTQIDTPSFTKLSPRFNPRPAPTPAIQLGERQIFASENSIPPPSFASFPPSPEFNTQFVSSDNSNLDEFESLGSFSNFREGECGYYIRFSIIKMSAILLTSA